MLILEFEFDTAFCAHVIILQALLEEHATKSFHIKASDQIVQGEKYIDKTPCNKSDINK